VPVFGSGGRGHRETRESPSREGEVISRSGIGKGRGRGGTPSNDESRRYRSQNA
jgi:hypothetical protein